MTHIRTKPEDRQLVIQLFELKSLTPDPRNARKHSRKQINKLAKNIAKFGWVSAIVVDEARRILAGHARVEAAKQLGMNQVRLCQTNVAEVSGGW